MLARLKPLRPYRLGKNNTCKELLKAKTCMYIIHDYVVTTKTGVFNVFMNNIGTRNAAICHLIANMSK